MAEKLSKREYNRVSEKQREQIIVSLEKEKLSFLQVAKKLGIKPCTCKSVYRIFKQEGRMIKLNRRNKIRMETVFNVQFYDNGSKDSLVIKKTGEIFYDKDYQIIEEDTELQKRRKKNFFEHLLLFQTCSQKLVKEKEFPADPIHPNNILKNMQNCYQVLMKKLNEQPACPIVTIDSKGKMDEQQVETGSLHKKNGKIESSSNDFNQKEKSNTPDNQEQADREKTQSSIQEIQINSNFQQLQQPPQQQQQIPQEPLSLNQSQHNSQFQNQGQISQGQQSVQKNSQIILTNTANSQSQVLQNQGNFQKVPQISLSQPNQIIQQMGNQLGSSLQNQLTQLIGQQLQQQSLNMVQQQMYPLQNQVMQNSLQHQGCSQIAQQLIALGSMQQSHLDQSQIEIVSNLFQELKMKQGMNHLCESQLINMLVNNSNNQDLANSMPKIQQLFSMFVQLEQIEQLRHQSNVNFMKTLMDLCGSSQISNNVNLGHFNNYQPK